MVKKLLIVNQEQFGYHIDDFKYCKYLNTDFDIDYLCWDYGRNKISKNGINIIYISREGNLLKRNINFIKAIITQLKGQLYYFILLHYFRGCCIIPLIFNKKHKVHLDIRTGNISSNSLLRCTFNIQLRLESYFFKSVSIISPGLRKLLRVSHKAYILPLGADPMILNRQSDHKMSLIYVGILSHRHIDDTIVGIKLFHNMHPDFDIHYTIIGYGWNREEEQLREKIKINELEKYIDLKGYIPHNDLVKYFEKTNVGVSYIPITPYFEYQPATKTFEYLMAGMPVIATGTYENKKIINEQNGVIIADDPLSFANCLELLIDRLDSFDERLIRESVVEHNWESIVQRLKEFILKLN